MTDTDAVLTQYCRGHIAYGHSTRDGGPVHEDGYQASPLWRRTLAAGSRRDVHENERERLRASYLSTRDNAKILLNELARSVPDFTVHDITHVDALWETAGLVYGTGNPLNPAEAYVLGCAFVLHDAAMGLAAYGDDLPSVLGQAQWRDLLSVVFANEIGRWPTEAELSSPPAKVLRSCTNQAIRETHATHATTLVDQPWRTSAGNPLFLIHDTQLRESYGPLIGELAASHWWDVDELGSHFKHAKGSLPWQPVEWIIEPLKLACILRLADATQLDSRRAPSFLFALRKPEGHSREHWRFQEHLSRPHLADDRVTYSSLRPFDRPDAGAWWLALDYLRGVDRELKNVDALLHDLGRTRLAARAVAGVDSPERFSELFPVRGWRPVDADLQVSDVHGLVSMVGGEQLYGREPEVAVRELIQNAQDAVLARRVVDPTFGDGRVTVTLSENSGVWTLEVRDNGLGMDEDILVHGLLDFGRTGWRSSMVRTKFTGLAGGGFRPKGRFGIGFFSVFMLGDDVEVVTRRFDTGQADARRLEFRALNGRPMLTAVPPSERMPPGTTVRVRLKASPYDERAGVFFRTYDDELDELVQRLVPESSVPVETSERNGQATTTIAPFSASSAPAEEIFDRLYPLRKTGRLLEEQRIELRTQFAKRATEVLDAGSRRVGFAVLGHDLAFWSQGEYEGVVAVNGLRADEHMFFTGYLDGKPSRASRDKVEFVADTAGMRRWLASQEQALRKLDIFTAATQIEFAYTFFLAFGRLPDDHAVGMTSQGLLTIGGIEPWVAQRDEVFLSFGPPLQWNARPPQLQDPVTGAAVTLPDGCASMSNLSFTSIFDDVFPARNDTRYEAARHDRGPTWQKRWWRDSGGLRGLFVRRACQAWSCDIGEILAPVADRNWSDVTDSGVPGLGPLRGIRLHRPRILPR